MDCGTSSGPSDPLVLINHAPKLYACELCPKKYAIIMRFNRHQSDHQNGKIVTKPTKEIHREKQDWKCDICGKSLQNYSALKRHEVIHTEPDKTCGFCEKNFSDKSDLVKHERTHSATKFAKCSLAHITYPLHAHDQPHR